MELLAATTSIRFGAIALVLALAVAAVVAATRTRNPTRDAMTFLEHVDELRRRGLWVIGVFLVTTVVAFTFRLEARVWSGQTVPVLVPAVTDNLASQVFRALRDDLVPADVRLVTLRPMDGFMAEMTVAAAIGAAITLPLLLWHLVRFIGPGLRPNEQRAASWILVPATVLFALGAAFTYRFVLPFLFVALYGFNDAVADQPLLHVQEFVTFTTGLMLSVGAAFETPVVMALLSRLGIVAPRTWLSGWRYAVVGILVLSAFITDPTVISQVMVAVPLVVLYFAGVGVSYLVAPKQARTA